MIAQNPCVRRGRLLDLIVRLNNIEVTTAPDTGASVNAVSMLTLKRLKQYTWTDNTESDIKLGNKKNAQSLGQVLLSCSIASDRAQTSSEGHKVDFKFHVFRKLATGVQAIIGQSILARFNILMTEPACLMERVITPNVIPRFMSIPGSHRRRERLNVFLNNKHHKVMPDTGSELNLISGTYASQHGFKITPVHDEMYVEFADGTFERLVKQVVVMVNAANCSARWSTRQPPASERATAVSKTKVQPTSSQQTFYVLEDLVYDIVFSQCLLDSMDAWRMHTSAFETTDEEGHIMAMFKRKVVVGTKALTSKSATIDDACIVVKALTFCDVLEAELRQHEARRREKYQEQCSRFKGKIRQASGSKKQELEEGLRKLIAKNEEDKKAYEVKLGQATS